MKIRLSVEIRSKLKKMLKKTRTASELTLKEIQNITQLSSLPFKYFEVVKYSQISVWLFSHLNRSESSVGRSVNFLIVIIMFMKNGDSESL